MCLAALEHEAGIFNAFRHENIVGLEGICLKEPKIGVVLEYCHGGRLKEVYAKLPDVSAQIIIDWARQIAEGMHYMHYGQAIRYFHRDLTTSNILVKQSVCTCNVANTKRLSDMYDHQNIRGDGVCAKCHGTACNRLTLKISDFGMARSERDNRKSDFGTVAYQAPEVMTKGGTSNTSDTYSFGVVIWELFTKCVPFKELEEASIIYHVGKLNLKPPIPDNCPSDIKQLLTDCWEINPDDRPDFNEIRTRLTHLKQEYGAVDDGLNTFQKDMRHEIEQKMSIYAKIPKGREHDILIREKSNDRNNVMNSITEYIKEVVVNQMKQRPRKGKGPKIDRSQIGHPQGFSHIHSVRPMALVPSPHNSPSQTRHVKSNEQDTLFFTLPRKPRDAAVCNMIDKMRRLSEDEAAKRKDFSRSTPNLAIISCSQSPPLQTRSRAPTHSHFSRCNAHLARCNALRKFRSSKTSFEDPDSWSMLSTEATTSDGIEAVSELSTIDDSCVTVADEIPDVVVTDVSGACSSDDRDDWSRVSFPVEDTNDDDYYQPGLRAARRDQHRFDSTDDSLHDMMSPSRSTAGRSSSVSSLLSTRSNLCLTPTAELCSPRKASKSPLACLSKFMLQAGTVLAAPTGCDIKKHATPEGELPSTSELCSLSRNSQNRLSGNLKSLGFEGSSPSKSKQPSKPGRSSDKFQRTDNTRVYGRKKKDFPSPTSSVSPILSDNVPISLQPQGPFSHFASPVRIPPTYSPAAAIHNSSYVSHERARSATEDRHHAVQNNAYVTQDRNRNRAHTVAPPNTVTSPSYFPTKPSTAGVQNSVYFPVAKPEVPARTVAVSNDALPRPKDVPYQRLTVDSDTRMSLDSPVPITTPVSFPTPMGLAPGIPIRPATLDFNTTSSVESGICTAESSTILSQERSISPPRERPPPPPLKSTPPPVPPRRIVGRGPSPSPPALPPRSSPRLNAASPSQG